MCYCARALMTERASKSYGMRWRAGPREMNCGPVKLVTAGTKPTDMKYASLAVLQGQLLAEWSLSANGCGVFTSLQWKEPHSQYPAAGVASGGQGKRQRSGRGCLIAPTNSARFIPAARNQEWTFHAHRRLGPEWRGDCLSERS